MNKYIVILFAAFAILCCNEKRESSYIHNDLFVDNLKDNIENVEETSYTTDSTGTIISEDSCCVSITEYDANGFRTRQIKKDIYGNEREGQVYFNRYKNGMVKELRSTRNGKLINIISGTLNKNCNYGDANVYDSTGKLIFYYSDVHVNGYGKIISMKSFKPNGSLQQIIVNKYNKQIWVGGYIKDRSGKDVFSITIKLNEKMNPLETKQTVFTNGVATKTITRYKYSIYDTHGNWVQRNEIDENGNIHKLIKRQINYRNK